MLSVSDFSCLTKPLLWWTFWAVFHPDVLLLFLLLPLLK